MCSIVENLRLSSFVAKTNLCYCIYRKARIKVTCSFVLVNRREYDPKFDKTITEERSFLVTDTLSTCDYGWRQREAKGATVPRREP